MRVIESAERVHVLDGSWSAREVAQGIAMSGLQEDPFYVMDLGDVVEKYNTWTRLLPRVEPFYAVKCNDSPILLRTLAALGTGFDCASKNEIATVINMGVAPERIIFANPAKMASHIRYARASEVRVMTFDSDTELAKIKQSAPDTELVIRIRCDATDAQCPLGMKFGCDPLNEAPRLLKLAAVLGLEVIGISFHVGSGCRDTAVWHRAVSAASRVAARAKEAGHRIRLLDIGGGFPGHGGCDLTSIAAVINTAIDEYFPDTRVIAEPGRYFAASAFTLAACIHSKRLVGEGDTSNMMYFINDGVYGSFNCVLYDHQVVAGQPLTGDQTMSSELHPSSIWGPSCDGLDCVLPSVPLPDMPVGEWLVFEDMGAYTMPVASPFNGFPVPRAIAVASTGTWLELKDKWPLSPDFFEPGSSMVAVRGALSPPPSPVPVRDSAHEMAVFVECAIK